MATADVANALVNMCRQGQFPEVVEQYYADDIVSTEAMAMPGQDKVQKGIEAIKAKNKWWIENHEVHGLEIDGPIVAGSHFACTMKMDVTVKQSGQRMTMQEVCVYEVKGDKIVAEQFFYNMGG